MSTSFKRIISHEELGNLNKKMSVEETTTNEALKMTPNTDTVDKAAPLPAVLIESTEEHQNEERTRHHAKKFQQVSTLSADKSFDDESNSTQEASAGMSRNELNMARLDSRASDVMARTQRTGSGSSGTFGWFIDVHGGDGTPKIREEDRKKKAIASSSKKEGAEDDSSGDGLTQFIDITQQNLDTEAPLSSAMAVTAPNYIFEQTLSDQMLWKQHAGNRPPQPEEERAYYEMLWRQNFALSQVQYDFTPESLNEGTSPIDDSYGQNYSSYNLATDFMATDAEVAEAIERLHGTSAVSTPVNAERPKPQVVNKIVKGAGSNEDLTVLIKGDNVFGTTVSKSFDRDTPSGTREVDTVNISVASYRVVESKKHGKYAQFLVIYREGGIRDTIGVWKRYSDFEALSRKVVESHDSCSSVLANMSPLAVTEEGDVEHLPNAITSWRLLKKRQRWFRCLDAGYLSLKVFLLERFLHDILFESSSPNLLRDFVIYDKSGSK